MFFLVMLFEVWHVQFNESDLCFFRDCLVRLHCGVYTSILMIPFILSPSGLQFIVWLNANESLKLSSNLTSSTSLWILLEAWTLYLRMFPAWGLLVRRSPWWRWTVPMMHHALSSLNRAHSLSSQNSDSIKTPKALIQIKISALRLRVKVQLNFCLLHLRLTAS